jgi:hypothetical protein
MLLDKYLPQWDFTEVHTKRIKASPEAAWRALQQTTLGEIHWFVRFLFFLRGLPEKLVGRTEDGFGLKPDEPLLGQMLVEGFVKIDEDVPREIVFGLIVPGKIGRVWKKESDLNVTPGSAPEMLAFKDPRFLHVIANFYITEAPETGSVRVSTESRTRGLSDNARRSFRPYWWVIRPWSGLIRRLWLNAIKRRAERPA